MVKHDKCKTSGRKKLRNEQEKQLPDLHNCDCMQSSKEKRSSKMFKSEFIMIILHFVSFPTYISNTWDELRDISLRHLFV